MTEADTCRTYIVPALHAAGWEDDYIREQLVLTPGRIVPLGEQKHFRQEGLRADFVLFIRKNIPIAVLEAKAEYKKPADGLQQAMQYAEMLGVKFALSSNGHGIVMHDYSQGREYDLSQFPSPDELWQRQRGEWQLQGDQDAKDALTAYFEEVGGKIPRYYQQTAIRLNSIAENRKGS
jgi:type I restriction enzyme R subunit